MSADKRRNYYQTNYYNGSAARKLNTVPQTHREVEEIRPVAPVKVPKTKVRRKPAIGFMMFVTMTGALMMTLYTAVDYVKAQLEVHDLTKAIAASELQLSQMTMENEAALKKINSKIDLEDIFNKATNELGMVFPNNNKVITYKAAVCEYIRQYDSVPEANAEDLLEKLFH